MFMYSRRPLFGPFGPVTSICGTEEQELASSNPTLLHFLNFQFVYLKEIKRTFSKFLYNVFIFSTFFSIFPSKFHSFLNLRHGADLGRFRFVLHLMKQLENRPIELI